MIARRWSARATRDNATRYTRYFRETLTPHLRAAPELRYAVDSRIELFPEDVWERYFAVSEARTGWEELLAGDDVRGLLLDPDQASGLLDVIGTDPSWRLVLEDEGGAVYVRDGAT